MNQDGEITQEPEIPRHVLRKPKNHAAEEKQYAANDKAPEKKFLPRIVTSCGGHLVVFIPNVVSDRVPPRLVCSCRIHLRRPHAKHLQDGSGENQACPRMQHPRDLPAAQQCRNPEAPRRIERQAGEHQINIGTRSDPMRQAFMKLVPQNAPVSEHLVGVTHEFSPPEWMSSSSRDFGPKRR